MSRFAEEQVDRLIMLVQKQADDLLEYKKGAANNNPRTGFFVTQPWEYTYTDRRES